MDWLITRFHVPSMFGKLARRFRVNSTVSRTGLNIISISRNLPHGQHSVQNPVLLNQQVVMICVLNCARICFTRPGKQFLYNLQLELFLIILTLLSAPACLSLPNKLLILLKQMTKQLCWQSLRRILVEPLADGGSGIFWHAGIVRGAFF